MDHIFNDEEEEKKEKEVKKNKIPIFPKKAFFKNKFTKANVFFKSGNYGSSIGNFLLGILFFIIFIVAILIPAIVLLIGFNLVVSPIIDIIKIRELNVENLGYFDTAYKIVSYSLSWFVLFVIYIGLLYHNKKIKIKSLRFYILTTLCCLLISSLIRYQNLRSHNFLYEKIDKYVSFTYENKIVKSSDKKRLLGITSEYIFLRDIESKTNYIYKIDNVKNLEITSLKNDE